LRVAGHGNELQKKLVGVNWIAVSVLVHGIDASEKSVIRKQPHRCQVMKFF
jgi:hypothetical protein